MKIWIRIEVEVGTLSKQSEIEVEEDTAFGRTYTEDYNRRMTFLRETADIALKALEK